MLDGAQVQGFAFVARQAAGSGRSLAGDGDAWCLGAEQMQPGAEDVPHDQLGRSLQGGFGAGQRIVGQAAELVQGEFDQFH
ncbi:hypothetical protein D3C78_1689380 [compost metagenome]